MLISLLAPFGAGGVAQASLRPLLSLARGQVLVALGPGSEWLPVSGTPTDLTLRAGRPDRIGAGHLNAYVSLRSPAGGCPAHPHHALAFHHLYAPANFTAHHYEATLPGVVARQRRAALACVWLGRRPGSSRLAARQRIPLLDGLFAASVTALSPGAYTLAAMRVSQGFRYRATSSVCGRTYRDPLRTVPADALGVEEISYGQSSCAGDSSRFTFTTAVGQTLGTLDYSVAQASKGDVLSLGGCELDPVTGITLSRARDYVRADGCLVSGVLAAPRQAGVPRGSVLEALVDGGEAEVAPAGSSVELVVNGR